MLIVQAAAPKLSSIIASPSPSLSSSIISKRMVQITCFGKTFKNRTIYQIVIATTFLLILATVVPTLAILNNRIGLERQTKYSNGRDDPGSVTETWDGVIIWANVSAVSAGSFTIKVRFNLDPSGIYANRIGQGLSVFQSPVSLRSGGKVVKFAGNDILRSTEVSFPIIEGDSNQYPFDKYFADFVLGMTDENGTAIPIAFGIVGSLQSWTVIADVNDLEGNIIHCSLVATRTWIIKFFSIFVVITMWVLSLTILTLVSTIWFRDRKVEPPIIGLCASLLFALPAVRNTQPDSPPIGMTMDVGGFFFNMAIVAFSAFLAMLNYIYRYRREKPAAPKPEPVPIPPAYIDGDGKEFKDQVKIHVEAELLAAPSQDIAETATLLESGTDKTK